MAATSEVLHRAHDLPPFAGPGPPPIPNGFIGCAVGQLSVPAEGGRNGHQRDFLW